jgi:hypothetical protein
MKLVSAAVGPFKSFDRATPVSLEKKVTAIVGVNEAGKSAFLQAIHKALGQGRGVKFDPIQDYPRRRLAVYEARHATSPEVVVVLELALDSEEIAALRREHAVAVADDFRFSLSWRYDNSHTAEVALDESSAVQACLDSTPDLSAEALAAGRAAPTLRALVESIQALAARNPADEALLSRLRARIEAASAEGWANPVAYEVWKGFLSPRLPTALYFDDYQLLPGKVNINELRRRIQQEEKNPGALEGGYRSARSLLRMAGVGLDSLMDADGYESAKARLEALGNTITDQIFGFWKQNENNLDVEFDVRPDPRDTPPFNDGPNLYVRIKNRRHRVTVPFDQRSKGFIWFFSFLVWFDTVQETVKAGRPLILLLDEPGLNLHALAQADFLRYIGTLGEKHQVVYTTHSPFMVRADRLDAVRVVEDRADTGSVVSANLTSSDARTLLPLQAALGYSVGQSLFIARRNLVVEGPADMLYLQHASAQLESANRTGLRGDVVIVPAGGLDKLATFIALLGANDLELVVLHDTSGHPEQRLEVLVEQKLIEGRRILSYGMFRQPGDLARRKAGVPRPEPGQATALMPTDIEDLLTVPLFLQGFNAAYAKELPQPIPENDLGLGPRIVARLDAYLASQGFALKNGGGFNHYRVASKAASMRLQLDPPTLDRFEALFLQVNRLFSAAEVEESGEGGREPLANVRRVAT